MPPRLSSTRDSWRDREQPPVHDRHERRTFPPASVPRERKSDTMSMPASTGERWRSSSCSVSVVAARAGAVTVWLGAADRGVTSRGTFAPAICCTAPAYASASVASSRISRSGATASAPATRSTSAQVVRGQRRLVRDDRVLASSPALRKCTSAASTPSHRRAGHARPITKRSGGERYAAMRSQTVDREVSTDPHGRRIHAGITRGSSQERWRKTVRKAGASAASLRSDAADCGPPSRFMGLRVSSPAFRARRRRHRKEEAPDRGGRPAGVGEQLRSSRGVVRLRPKRKQGKAALCGASG